MRKVSVLINFQSDYIGRLKERPVSLEGQKTVLDWSLETAYIPIGFVP